MKMRWAAHTSLSQDTHYTGGGGSQEFMGAVKYWRFGRPDSDVHTSRFEPLSYVLGTSAFESSFISYKGIQGAFEHAMESVAEGSAEAPAILQRHAQGCVERSGGLREPKLPLSVPTGVRLVECEFYDDLRHDGVLRSALLAAYSDPRNAFRDPWETAVL
jgi:hypothetical protein